MRRLLTHPHLTPEKVEEYRLRDRARRKLDYAVRKGRMVRPSKCPVCGSSKEIQGHHVDYERPLDVEWLCRTCHRWRHDYDEKLENLRVA